MAWLSAAKLAIGPLLKNKKFRWGAIIVGGLVLVWGMMAWNDWTISSLREDLMVEELERDSVEKAKEDQETAENINRTVLNKLLENQREIREENKQLRQAMQSDVDSLQTDWRERERELEQRISQASEQGDEDDKQQAQIQLIDERSAHYDDVSERVIDGMYDSYCNAVEDSSRCPERKPDS